MENLVAMVIGHCPLKKICCELQSAKANPDVIQTIDEFESGLNEAATDAEGFDTPIMGGEEDIEKDDTIADLEINSP